MVQVLDQVFTALGDATRRSIVEQLTSGEASVSELAEPHRMSLAAVSKHLSVLERAGLVRKRRQGKSIRCSLAVEPLKQATSWLENYRQFWEGTLDNLGEFLERTKDEESSE